MKEKERGKENQASKQARKKEKTISLSHRITKWEWSVQKGEREMVIGKGFQPRRISSPAVVTLIYGGFFSTMSVLAKTPRPRQTPHTRSYVRTHGPRAHVQQNLFEIDAYQSIIFFSLCTYISAGSEAIEQESSVDRTFDAHLHSYTPVKRFFKKPT